MQTPVMPLWLHLRSKNTHQVHANGFGPAVSKCGCRVCFPLMRKTVSKEKWENLEDTFVLSDKPNRVVFYFEGPAPGVNILIELVFLWCHGKNGYTEDENIILNPEFEDGVNSWTGRGCKIVVHDSLGDGKIFTKSGKFFAATIERTQNWNRSQQDVTGKFNESLLMKLLLSFGSLAITLLAPMSELPCGKLVVWSKAVIYLEGPPLGTDILLDGCMVKHAEKLHPSPPPVIENPDYGVNIITNSNLSDGTNGFFPLGSCTLNVVTGSPRILPPSASGKCIHVSNRTQTWIGPAQMITDNIKLYVTYQVSAWVRLSPGASAGGPQNVNVALEVDSRWVNGGQVEINNADMWHEICGSFRIEKQPAKVIVIIQGPAAGISFLVAGLQIFAEDRQARFRHLKRQTDKIRIQDVTLKFPESRSTHVTMVIVKQSQNSFLIGSSLSRTNMDNEDFVTFFVKNFNWAVFRNELKWYWTES